MLSFWNSAPRGGKDSKQSQRDDDGVQRHCRRNGKSHRKMSDDLTRKFYHLVMVSKL